MNPTIQGFILYLVMVLYYLLWGLGFFVIIWLVLLPIRYFWKKLL